MRWVGTRGLVSLHIHLCLSSDEGAICIKRLEGRSNETPGSFGKGGNPGSRTRVPLTHLDNLVPGREYEVWVKKERYQAVTLYFTMGSSLSVSGKLVMVFQNPSMSLIPENARSIWFLIEAQKLHADPNKQAELINQIGTKLEQQNNQLSWLRQFSSFNQALELPKRNPVVQMNDPSEDLGWSLGLSQLKYLIQISPGR